MNGADGVVQWYSSLPGILNALDWIGSTMKEKQCLQHSEIYE